MKMIGTIDIFQTEAREHLAALESALLELETSPTEIELIDQAFRAMHTIKGAGGMFGFADLTEFTHHLETAFDQVRSGILQINQELISVMLDAGDHIGTLLDHTSFNVHQKITSELLLKRLYEIVPDHAAQTKPSDLNEKSNPSLPNELALSVFRIMFTPDEATFRNGFDVIPILRELASLGNCIVTTKIIQLPSFLELNPESCYLAWDVSLVTEQDKNAIEDTFMFVFDDWQIRIEKVDLSDHDDNSDLIGELLVSRGLISTNQLKEALTKHRELGEILCNDGLVSGDDIEAALVEQKVTRQLKGKKAKHTLDANIRVPATRLDSLMNLVGELVIVQARLNQIAHIHQSEDIIAISEELDLLTTQMREQTFSIRMLPIGTTFGRFRRLVRDLSKDLSKQIRLVTEGAETELDKMVIDKLADPLVHLIRNSIDHGIETPNVRQVNGKPPQGTITLIAEHADSNVVIRIIDDGIGLDVASIKQKAIESGLISKDEQLSDSEIHMLIFEAGFSTANQVSDISGRGVGMDVVRRSISDLGGKITIDSTMGKGTTFTIRLPMTLAIIEGLMIKIGIEHYVLPLSAVEECIEMASAGQSTTKKRLVTVRGEQIPYLSLREWFLVEGVRPEIEQIVITRIGDGHFGFCVDEVIGQYQTVIKRLGKLYEGEVGFSGATILGDGSVAMILDPQAIMDAVEQTTQSRKTLLNTR
jgi:two-component system chemotaxis sensor kinase CheA